MIVCGIAQGDAITDATAAKGTRCERATLNREGAGMSVGGVVAGRPKLLIINTEPEPLLRGTVLLCALAGDIARTFRGQSRRFLVAGILWIVRCIAKRLRTEGAPISRIWTPLP